MRRYLGPLVLAVVALVALWFLQQREDTPTTPAQPTSASTVATPPTPPAPITPTPAAATPTRTSTSGQTPPPPPPVNPVEPEGKPVDPTAPATPRDDRQAGQFAAYSTAAESFMNDFARPAAGVSEQQWWAKVKTHLSADAAIAYEGTDPQNVPFSKVTGEVTIVPSEAPSQLLAIARVPTDAGWYQVEMTTDEDGIRVTRASPEAGQR